MATMNNQSASPFFGKLPLELRRMVYCFCLFVGEVAPYDECHGSESHGFKSHDLESPYVPLLRTCKAIYLEAEPVIYENTFILSDARAVRKLFETTLPTPARKLLLKSLKLCLQINDHRPRDCLAPINDLIAHKGVQRRVTDTHQTVSEPGCEVYFRSKAVLMGVIWPLQIDPILDCLALNRLVLDLSETFCPFLTCSLEASAIMCFRHGFALQAPKVVEIKGWDAGRADVDDMVRECFRMWTAKRAGRRLSVGSEAQSWLLKAVRKEGWEG